jgi:hypothetical protein
VAALYKGGVNNVTCRRPMGVKCLENLVKNFIAELSRDFERRPNKNFIGSIQAQLRAGRSTVKRLVWASSRQMQYLAYHFSDVPNAGAAIPDLQANCPGPRRDRTLPENIKSVWRGGRDFAWSGSQ